MNDATRELIDAEAEWADTWNALEMILAGRSATWPLPTITVVTDYNGLLADLTAYVLRQRQ